MFLMRSTFEIQVKYLYGLLTQTSTVETNSRGKAYWARDQLLNAYREAIEEEVWDNLYLSLYGSIGSIGGSRGSKGAPAKGLKSTPKAAQTPKNSTSTSYSKAKYDCNCFTAGTKVQTDEGEKNIEDIQVGDKVLSKDEETGEVAYKEVTATFNHETDEIYQIHVGDQVIESTYNHPFWVDGKGWTYVKDLEVGDLLVQSDGNTLKIESIELLHKQVTVYNMTVDEFHTYFVSDLGIWVHNTGPCPFGKYEDAPYHGTTNNSVKNKAPIDGQDALNKSLSIGPNTDRRIAVSNGEFVVLDKTSDGLYHGHVRSWSELTPTMQAILRKEGLVDECFA